MAAAEARAPAGTEGLPRAFLQSLRTLFDILDDRRRGCVPLREIEARWRGADARELPPGVLEGLRRQAPASGLLTFERFVAGLRAALPPPPPPPPPPDGALPRAPRPPRARPARAPEPQPGPDGHADDHAGTESCRALGTPRPRSERRRHTITSGVDCELLKQMKELEQEQEVLLQGLEMMARGQDWYQQQLQRVQERQRRRSRSRADDDLGATESPRPLGQLLPKVQEVARCLGELLAAACAGRAVPSSSSGPLCPPRIPSPHSAPSWQQQTILMLKEQNRLLTQEVTDKSERITQLEQEKSALIKQLFQARALSQQSAGPLDSTFI
ncbi:suppressor APC domain-containing protein 2 [Thomomys bottae]